MLKNLRVVVTRVLTSEPKRLMVAKMNSWPTAPHRQKSRMSHPACGEGAFSAFSLECSAGGARLAGGGRSGWLDAWQVQAEQHSGGRVGGLPVGTCDR